MGDGWVKNYRKIEDWEWYRTPNMAHLFQHLIRAANHKDKRWQGIEIKKGQFVGGLPSLSEATGISIQSLRTCLSRLESSGEITRKSTNRFSVITICKYEIYQREDSCEQQAGNRQATVSQQATNNKQECKNEKNERSNKKITTSKSIFGTFQNVLLTDAEYQKLLNQFGDSLEDRINNLSEGIASKGYKYKSHYATILNWARRDNNAGGKRQQESFAEMKDRKMRQAMKEFVEE